MTDEGGVAGKAIRFERMPWQSIKPGFQVKRATSGGQALCMASYGPGFVDGFWCEDGHVGFVAEGRLTIEFPDGPQHYQAGDAFFIPAGKAARHRVSQPLGQAAVVFLSNGPVGAD